MTFLNDGQGRFHAGRFCGILYIATLLFFSGSQMIEPLWLARVTFALGWCLAFAQKEVPNTFAGMVHSRLRVLGLVLVTAALVVQFYLTRRGISLGAVIFPALIALLVFARFRFGRPRGSDGGKVEARRTGE